MKTFRCHMCEQIFDGAKKMRVALIGFVWEPALHNEPAELLDLCEACQYALLKAYGEAKNLRLSEVYEKQKTAFLLEKLTGLDRERNRLAKTKFAVRPSSLLEEPDFMGQHSRNYRREEQREWRF